jgi:hypothetical protein
VEYVTEVSLFAKTPKEVDEARLADIPRILFGSLSN